MWDHTIVFSQPDLAADGEIKSISFAGLAILPAIACLGYCLSNALRKTPLLRLCVLGVLAISLWIAPFAVLSWLGPCRSRLAQFALSLLGVLAGFRWVELMWGTGPAGFDSCLKNFVIYFTSPAEVLFEGGRLKASKDGLLSELLFRIAKHMLLGTVVLSIGKATAFTPFLQPGEDPATMPLLGFPQAIPALYLQTLYVYCMLATAMLMHRLLPAFFGIDSVDPFQTPLLLSVSLRDFWGRRWNLVIHRLMKRSFFEPLAGRSAMSRRVAGLLAFMMSGLFHEYMWFAVNWGNDSHYMPGLVLLFFLIQFFLCAVEATLATSSVGEIMEQLPAPLRTVWTTLVILPFGPLFLQGLQDMARECARQGQTVTIVPKTSGSQAMGSPPLDWIFCGLVGLLVSARGACKSRGRASAQPRKAPAIVAVMPACEGA
mmetsp:Transcript_11752/g.28129  ORF Transcript_11752/g.28129 Transcript_11752/m.28129 type:complete len:430 (-) Transcript_11752:32-1321(-)